MTWNYSQHNHKWQINIDMIQYTPKYIYIVVDTVKNKTMSEGSFESVYSFDHEGILGLNKHKNQSDTKIKGKWNVQIVYL